MTLSSSGSKHAHQNTKNPTKINNNLGTNTDTIKIITLVITFFMRKNFLMGILESANFDIITFQNIHLPRLKLLRSYNMLTF